MCVMDFLNLLFPIKCGICNKISKEAICNNCLNNLYKIEKVKIINVKNNYYNKHLYIFDYKGIIREKIIHYKFRDKAYLYNFFAKIILKNKKIYRFIKSYDIIIPVSISKQRFKERGYNQTLLIAKELAGNIESLELNNNVLFKIKNTAPQSTLNKAERKSNLKGAYAIKNETEVKNKKIVILDDVYTTGSTAKECSKLLKSAGAKQIGIITIAKD